jgi:hypothetical protein
LAWFKSSYFLWYCATIIGDIDLLRFLLVEINRYRIPLPNKMFFERCVNINNDVKNLILEEKKFLKEAAKLTDKDNREEMEKLTNKHNESGDSCCRSIDIDIFKYLGIRSGEAMDIYKTLKDLDVYDLRVGENKTFQDSLKALDV